MDGPTRTETHDETAAAPTAATPPAPETPRRDEPGPREGLVAVCAACGTEFGVNLRGDPERGVAPVPAGTRLACPVCRTLCPA